jgi:hypothetical protein
MVPTPKAISNQLHQLPLVVVAAWPSASTLLVGEFVDAAALALEVFAAAFLGAFLAAVFLTFATAPAGLKSTGSI